MITFDRVHKSFRTPDERRVVLEDATFELPAQRNIGILGSNGSGKSTLLRMIAGTELPTRGRVRRSVRVSFPIGFAGTFHQDLTARENASFLARVYGRPVARTLDWIADFSELGAYFDMPVRTYSSGMFARLAFSSSLAFDFDLYLIDEATEVGDMRFRQKCVAALRERLTHANVVIVSHNPTTIRTYCDCGAVLHGGALELYDTVDDAMVAYERILRRAA
ncbi:MAG: ABC transporter ATP-binding protein [Proteobacteria bacterium]|nr:ABC transporter ATP-binding protein [Pseudomonadota bacterium]